MGGKARVGLSTGIHRALEDLAPVLDRHRGRSIVIGGIAVIARGVPRVTRDVDVAFAGAEVTLSGAADLDGPQADRRDDALRPRRGESPPRDPRGDLARRAWRAGSGSPDPQDARCAWQPRGSRIEGLEREVLWLSAVRLCAKVDSNPMRTHRTYQGYRGFDT